MSKPRKPYGPNPPGRLAATMIKVLAAEMSDSGRLGRGKRYWNENAVIDLVIGHGVVTAEVQGSRSHPYVVTIGATPGEGVPTRRHVRVRCTCPDDDGFDSACKHAVAALFALSDEVAIDPTVVHRWRGKVRADGDLVEEGEEGDDADPDIDRSGWASVTRLQPRPIRPWERSGSLGREDRHEADDGDDGDVDDSDDLAWGSRLNRVVPLRRRPSDAARGGSHDVGDASDDSSDAASTGSALRSPQRRPVNVDPTITQIASMLHSPSGVGAPTFPPAHPLAHPPLADRVADEVLVSALTEFDVHWS